VIVRPPPYYRSSMVSLSVPFSEDQVEYFPGDQNHDKSFRSAVEVGVSAAF
jgi:hypothetical protein